MRVCGLLVVLRVVCILGLSILDVKQQSRTLKRHALECVECMVGQTIGCSGLAAVFELESRRLQIARRIQKQQQL